MTRIFWDTILLISGSLFTFGGGPSNATIEARVAIDATSAAAPRTSSGGSAAASSISTTTVATTAHMRTVNDSLVMFGAGPNNQSAETFIDAGTPTDTNVSSALNTSTTSSPSTSPTTAAAATTTASVPPVKKFVAAAVRSHFDDCPDSHRHFCFHGTCRFLILEETAACVCHQGFVGMRCEHADLLAVVATNHRQQTVATVLVLCVIGCVLIMVLCTLLHCWWRQDCRRRSHAHHYVSEKHGASCYPSESVV